MKTTVSKIDLNTSDPQPFIKATEDILGKEHCAWMISYGLFQEKSAFRMYAKGLGYSQYEVDMVAKDLDSYKDDPKWSKLIKESEFYVGVVESISPSPCSMLLYDKGDISEDIGLIKIKDEICCVMDGYNCDVYKYLKNDILTTKVWELIDNVCKRANIKIPSVKELEQKLDSKTFDIYEKGYTCTVNQADSDFATGLVMKYKPRSVAEMSAFVAAIRPGFKSLLNNFLEREPYSTEVPELDSLLEDSFHYLIYQESIMKYLIWLGIEESGTYSLIKKISKKKFTRRELMDLHSVLRENWIKKIGSEDGFERTWKVVEDAARYSFNASHSLSYAYDSLYCAYLKANYPYEYYTEALEMYSDDLDRTSKLTKELKAQGIEVRDIDFRNASYRYTYNREDKAIYKGLKSIKYINEEISLRLEEMSKDIPNNFLTVLNNLKGFSNKRQIDVLIRLGFFKYYGNEFKLLKIVEIYNSVFDKKVFKKDKYADILDIIKKYANKESDKQYRDVDSMKLGLELISLIPEKEISMRERVYARYEFAGNCDLKIPNADPNDLFIVDLKKYNRKTWYKCYSFKFAKELIFYVYNNKNNIDLEKINKYDSIRVSHIEKKPKMKKTSEGWRKDNNDCENVIVNYQIIERGENNK